MFAVDIYIIILYYYYNTSMGGTNLNENYTHINSEENIYDLALKNIKDFGLFSFQLEQQRERAIISQASQMLTAFSIFSAALLMLMPVLLQYTSLSAKKILLSAGISFVPLLISLCSALLAQWRYPYYALRDIAEFKDHIYRNINDFDSQSKYYDLWSLQIAPVHAQLFKNNNKRVFFVKTSMICFLIAVLLLVFATIFVLAK